MSEPPIEPPDASGWCDVCGEPISKKWVGAKYVDVCACENDYYDED